MGGRGKKGGGYKIQMGGGEGVQNLNGKVGVGGRGEEGGV